MKKAVLIAAAAVLLAAAVLIFVSLNGENFTGTRVKNPDRYELDFTYMNQTDSNVMPLKAGDRLSIRWQLEKGSVGITVVPEDGGKPIYTAADVTAKEPDASFEVTVPADGNYSVVIRGKRAAGNIRIERIAPAEAPREG